MIYGRHPERIIEKQQAQVWGKSLFKKPCLFLKSVPKMQDLPPFSIPEFAFAGRSNVGKSSLINALVGVKGLAKASNTPGRTQMLNFFNLGDLLFLVDLPGYGYAAAPKTKVDQWVALTKSYFLGRPTLKRLFLLMDARRGIGTKDEEIMALLNDCAVPYQVVVTKGDKLSAKALDTLRQKLLKKHHEKGSLVPGFFITSSEKKEGLHELRDEISQLINKMPPHYSGE